MSPTPNTPHTPPVVTLRPHIAADVPVLFGFEQDPAWGAMSMTKPRDEATFRAAWARVLGEGLHQRAILADGVLCGSVGCLWSATESAGRWMLGYGLGRPFWGRGIASRAVGLLLKEVQQRPLYATAAASNIASIRVLEKHGFVLVEQRAAAETVRTLAREEVEMVLK